MAKTAFALFMLRAFAPESHGVAWALLLGGLKLLCEGFALGSKKPNSFALLLLISEGLMAVLALRWAAFGAATARMLQTFAIET